MSGEIPENFKEEFGDIDPERVKRIRQLLDKEEIQGLSKFELLNQMLDRSSTEEGLLNVVESLTYAVAPILRERLYEQGYGPKEVVVATKIQLNLAWVRLQDLYK